MLKKLTFLFLVLSLCVPFVLVSCGDELTDEEIANANFQEADTALTLSMWLPASVEYTVDTNGDGIPDQFNEKFVTRLNAVEEAINDYLRSNAYCTEIDLIVVNEKDYYNQLSAKFDNIKEIEATNGKAYLIANKYVNKAEKNPVTDIYQMAYPDVLEQQLDIFFVGGYDNYINYIESGDTYALNDFFTVGQSYNGLFKMIRQSFFDITKVNSNYYAIPNNHVYAEKGQYVLVDKNLFDSYSGTTWDVTSTLYDLESYIETIGNLGFSNVLPFYGQADDIPGVIYYDKDNWVAASVSDPSRTATNLLTMDEFKAYTSFYKGLVSKSFASSSKSSGKIAVQMFNGNLSEIDNIDDYYVIETVPPYASAETAYSSMFAISTHSANYERSMRILYLLQENEKVRTLLQYGVEEVDYEIGTLNGETVIYSNNSGYEMELLYTGNCYRTYPDYGVPMSYWDSVKEINLVTEPHPFLSLDLAIKNNTISEEQAANLAELKAIVTENNLQVWAKYFELNLDAFNSSNSTAAQIRKYLKDAKSDLDGAKTALEAAQNGYNNAETAEDKAYYAEQIETCQQDVITYQYEVDKWTAAQSMSELKSTFGTEKNALFDLYSKIYSSVYGAN